MKGLLGCTEPAAKDEYSLLLQMRKRLVDELAPLGVHTPIHLTFILFLLWSPLLSLLLRLGRHP